jgi:DNA invertase Pin-like site-specific DNA recombinase
MHIAVYYRVSTDKQDLASQKNTVERFIKEMKPSPTTTVYADEGMSGADTSRPGFQAMLYHAANGAFDAVLVYDLSRLSRIAKNAIRFILDLDDWGVGFISATQPVLNIDRRNPFAKTMLMAFAEIAELERTTHIGRVNSGLAAARARGVRLGPAPKITIAHQRLVSQLQYKGMSSRAIAERIGLSVGTTHKLMKLNGHGGKPLILSAREVNE